MTQMLNLLAQFCHCLLFFVILPYDSTQSMRQLYQLCHPLAMLGLSLPVSRIYRCDQTLVQTTQLWADASVGTLLLVVTSHGSDQPTHCHCLCEPHGCTLQPNMSGDSNPTGIIKQSYEAQCFSCTCKYFACI